MPRLGHETGVGLNAEKEIDVTIKTDANGRRLGLGCSREITKEESVLFRKQGKLKCPGPQDEHGHQLVDDTEPGQRFVELTDPRYDDEGRMYASHALDAPAVVGPCGNYMMDLTRNHKMDRPVAKPALYCPTCHFGIRLFRIT